MLVAENISKRFAGTLALKDVSLELPAGEVTAIIGENGAGKSTLMKILSGVYADYEGRVTLRGQAVRFASPGEARMQGVAIIHQELDLVPGLSITENLFLGRERLNRFGLLDKGRMKLEAEAVMRRLKLDVPAATLVGDLKVGQQQVVEIGKALLTGADVLIMDEPSSAISDQEVEVLFSIIGELTRQGKAVAYISHKLDELFRIAHRYVVLRDGQVTGSGLMKSVGNANELIARMTGRAHIGAEKTDTRVIGDCLLSLRGVSSSGLGGKERRLALRDISLELRAGEVLGLFGIMGAGRTELMELIAGLYRPDAGTMHLGGEALVLKGPADAIAKGIVLVPEDRKRHGFIPVFDVKSNISLSAMTRVTRAGVIREAKEQDLAANYIRSMQIKASSQRQQVLTLSGGNQQKVVLARCLATGPNVLLLDEPTRGIDANAKNEIYKLIFELAGKGMGLLVVSSELPEVLALSDRVLVMAEGTLTAEFTPGNASEHEILKAAIPRSA